MCLLDFLDPEDGLWEKNNSEGMVRNSELEIRGQWAVVQLQLNS